MVIKVFQKREQPFPEGGKEDDTVNEESWSNKMPCSSSVTGYTENPLETSSSVITIISNVANVK